MKRFTLVFAALMLCAVFAYGQNETANYAGTWTLDASKSELGERARIKSMTMTVAQTADELSYERKIEREEREDGGEGGGFGGGRPGGGGGMGGGRGGGMGGGNQSATFTLDGKETKATGEMGTSKQKAKSEKGVLKLTQERSFQTPMGAMSLNTTEKWTLSEDGKTLTVKSETATPRGSRNMKMVFTLNAE